MSLFFFPCSSFLSALSTCLTLSRGTWGPSLWSHFSYIPPTTPENLATSATRRPPPSGTTKPWPQTGTGSTPARRPSRAESALWLRTASPGTRRHLQLERHGTNSDTETRKRERGTPVHYFKYTQWTSCVHTLETHSHYTHWCGNGEISRVKMSICWAVWWRDNEERMKRRIWGEGQPACDESLIYVPVPPLGTWRRLAAGENLSNAWKTTYIICRTWKERKKFAQIGFYIVWEDYCYLKRTDVFFQMDSGGIKET